MLEREWWAPRAWLQQRGHGGWAEGVLLRAGADGHWAEVRAGVPAAPEGVTPLHGPVLPGLVNAHSHAFQRAFAGLSERREAEADDFWSWRDRMYRVALRISPQQLQAVAAMLYAELLCGGYTQVCEFHYLQHRPDGQAFDDPLAMSWALAEAAEATGIGLTMLPVLYERAGFHQPTLREDQRRFRTDAAWVAQAQRSVQRAGRPRLNAGVAIHSLRAARPDSITTLLKLIDGQDGPVHIHVAEQTQEVDDCLAATGRRPLEWLLREIPIDARWQLVHATHTTLGEIDEVAASGAGVVICPSTEGNLGDGLADIVNWLHAGVPMAVGSDSHVTRAWPEELRWLEYGQRLLHRRRNIAAAPGQGQPASAARLFDAALQAGAGAAGLGPWGLQPGARADFLVLDAQDSALLGVPAKHTLDALVFSSPTQAISEVYVAAERMVRQGRHRHHTQIAQAFGDAMQALWAEPASAA